MQNYLGPQSFESVYFEFGGFHRKIYRRCCLQQTAGQGDTESVVAAGGGHHSPFSLLFVEVGNGVNRAAYFKRVGRLQTLQLEPDISSGEIAEITASNKRSRAKIASHGRGCFFQGGSV